jgi:hypothetical protein
MHGHPLLLRLQMVAVATTRMAGRTGIDRTSRLRAQMRRREAITRVPHRMAVEAGLTRHHRVLIPHRAAVIRHLRDRTQHRRHGLTPLRLQAVPTPRPAVATLLLAAVMAAEVEAAATVAVADRMEAVAEDLRTEAEGTPEAAAEHTDTEITSGSSMARPEIGAGFFC